MPYLHPAATALAFLLILILALRTSRLSRRLKELRALAKSLQATNLNARHDLYAMLAHARLAALGRQPRLPIAFTSELGEDHFLWDLFDRRCDGYYIECGAFDGKTLSVTYPFEALGWTGLLVEALPEPYKHCLAARPHSRVVHAALSRRGSTGSTTFTIVGDDAQAQMLSFLTTNDPHRRNLRKRRDDAVAVTVPLADMDAVLTDNHPPIDFAVIDVEGGELDLLHGFDLDRHRPRVLLVEDLSNGKDPRVAMDLARRHYTRVTSLGRNDVYIRSDEHALIQRARRLTGIIE